MAEPAPVAVDPLWNLVTGTVGGAGYHTRLATGTPVHPLRESVNHAVELLARGDDAQAASILTAVLSHQDVDPVSPTYGIWPWFADEPLPQMAPPDWNWADFIGAALAEILVRFPDRLPAGLRQRVGDAIGHAAWSIFRRNVAPGYTNICIMGAAVTAAAGEILGEPRLLAYGRRRLANFLAHTDEHGSFNEYNSPTYTIVALEEIERILRLVRDAETRAAAERLRRICWTIIAEHFHPGTGQWAGPWSRAYADWLQPASAALLARKTGAAIAARTGQAEPPPWAPLGPPCPADLMPRFRALPEREAEIRRRFARGPDEARSVIGTTWMDADATLGSINRDTTWTQRRPVLGYWRTPADPAVALRVALVKNGRDFASGFLWTQQRGPRVLASFGMVTDQGDWHCHLDRPADGTFAVADLRLRVELQGRGVRAEALAGGRFALSAGGHRAVVHPLAGCRFDGAAVAWECSTEGERACVDAILHRGAERRLEPARLGEVLVALGLELLPAAAAAVGATPTAADDGALRTVAWNGLEVRHRRGPGRFAD